MESDIYQLAIENMSSGRLPDGPKLKVGDCIRYNISMHAGFTKVILHEGKLCMERNFMYGDKTPIDTFINGEGSSSNKITKL